MQSAEAVNPEEHLAAAADHVERSIYLEEYSRTRPSTAAGHSAKPWSTPPRPGATPRIHEEPDPFAAVAGEAESAWVLDAWGDAPSVIQQGQFITYASMHHKDIPTSLPDSSTAPQRRALSAGPTRSPIMKAAAERRKPSAPNLSVKPLLTRETRTVMLQRKKVQQMQLESGYESEEAPVMAGRPPPIGPIPIPKQSSPIPHVPDPLASACGTWHGPEVADLATGLHSPSVFQKSLPPSCAMQMRLGSKVCVSNDDASGAEGGGGGKGLGVAPFTAAVQSGAVSCTTRQEGKAKLAEDLNALMALQRRPSQALSPSPVLRCLFPSAAASGGFPQQAPSHPAEHPAGIAARLSQAACRSRVGDSTQGIKGEADPSPAPGAAAAAPRCSPRIPMARRAARPMRDPSTLGAMSGWDTGGAAPVDATMLSRGVVGGAAAARLATPTSAASGGARYGSQGQSDPIGSLPDAPSLSMAGHAASTGAAADRGAASERRVSSQPQQGALDDSAVASCLSAPPAGSPSHRATLRISGSGSALVVPFIAAHWQAGSPSSEASEPGGSPLPPPGMPDALEALMITSTSRQQQALAGGAAGAQRAPQDAQHHPPTQARCSPASLVHRLGQVAGGGCSETYAAPTPRLSLGGDSLDLLSRRTEGAAGKAGPVRRAAPVAAHSALPSSVGASGRSGGPGQGCKT